MARHLLNVTLRNAPDDAGYRRFRVGELELSRDEYFAHVTWPSRGGRLTHTLPADVFLRAMMRCVAWDFFYGWVYFDDVFGTRNLYGRVQFYAGLYVATYRDRNAHYVATVPRDVALRTCRELLLDWTNAGYDPFVAPAETGLGWIGPKRGSNQAAVERRRGTCRRMIGLPGDAPIRSDEQGFTVNRAFADVPQDAPEIHAEPGFEHALHAINLFAHVSRADTTWNPSVSSVCGNSLFCTTAEEYLMPVKHANDRIEWFLQLSDQIEWKIEDRDTGELRARVVMRAGDVAAMPADIRHQGFARKRSMLLVWENADPALPEAYARGELPPSMREHVQGGQP